MWNSIRQKLKQIIRKHCTEKIAQELKISTHKKDIFQIHSV